MRLGTDICMFKSSGRTYKEVKALFVQNVSIKKMGMFDVVD
jgi:hypothetical protein